MLDHNILILAMLLLLAVFAERIGNVAQPMSMLCRCNHDVSAIPEEPIRDKTPPSGLLG